VFIYPSQATDGQTDRQQMDIAVAQCSLALRAVAAQKAGSLIEIGENEKIRRSICNDWKIAPQERRTAERLQYACPVHDTYDDTTSAYHDVTCQSLNCVKSRPLGTSRLLLATHNRQTVDYVIQQ